MKLLLQRWCTQMVVYSTVSAHQWFCYQVYYACVKCMCKYMYDYVYICHICIHVHACVHPHTDAMMHVCASYGVWITTPNPDIAVSSHFILIIIIIFCKQMMMVMFSVCVFSCWNVIRCQYDNVNVSTGESLSVTQVMSRAGSWECMVLLSFYLQCTNTCTHTANTHTQRCSCMRTCTHIHIHTHCYFIGNIFENIQTEVKIMQREQETWFFTLYEVSKPVHCASCHI